MFVVGVLQGLAAEGLLGLRGVAVTSSPDPSATGNADRRLSSGSRPAPGAVLTCLDSDGSVEVEVEVSNKGEAPCSVADPSGRQLPAQGPASSVNLSPEQFARVFPFYMVLDRQGNLTQVRGLLGIHRDSRRAQV